LFQYSKKGAANARRAAKAMMDSGTPGACHRRKLLAADNLGVAPRIQRLDMQGLQNSTGCPRLDKAAPAQWVISDLETIRYIPDI
jgi:hypothetical protein